MAVNVEYTVQAGDYDKWIYPVGTWSRANNRLRLYVKSAAALTGLYPTAGAWTGSDLSDISSRIGTISTTQYWPNALAGFFLHTSELAAADITNFNDLATAKGVAASEAWAA